MNDRLPSCFGFHERDSEECIDLEEGCEYCVLCSNFTNHLKFNEMEADFYLETGYTFQDGEYSHPKMGTKRFLNFCKNLKVAKSKTKKKYKPRRRNKINSYAIAAAKQKERAAERREQIEELVSWFRSRLLEVSDGKFKVRERGNVIRPGEIYIVDRRQKTGYLTFKVRKAHGKDQPIVCLIPKTRTLTFNALLPIELETFKKKARTEDRDRFQFQPVKSGFFRTITYGVDKRGLSYLAELVFDLSKRRIIDITPGGTK